jgi:hypothetical protein
MLSANLTASSFAGGRELSETSLSQLFGPRSLARLAYERRWRLDKTINAMQFEKPSGIRIIWTDSFADHLRLRDDDTAIELFPPCLVLEIQ